MAEFIRIPVICVDAISALSDSERGRLLAALVRYASGDELEEPRGAERSLWLILKAQMDRDMEISMKISQARTKAGSAGGVAKSSKRKQSVANDSKIFDPSPSLPSPPTPPLFITPTTQENTPKEKPPKGGKKKSPFSPPTVEEVAAYCRERNNGIDPEAFVDHYEARGWRYNGNVAMKDWKAAVRTWERRKKEADIPSGGDDMAGLHQVCGEDGVVRWVRN